MVAAVVMRCILDLDAGRSARDVLAVMVQTVTVMGRGRRCGGIAHHCAQQLRSRKRGEEHQHHDTDSLFPAHAPSIPLGAAGTAGLAPLGLPPGAPERVPGTKLENAVNEC
jgi:hypothetical protein